LHQKSQKSILIACRYLRISKYKYSFIQGKVWSTQASISTANNSCIEKIDLFLTSRKPKLHANNLIPANIQKVLCSADSKEYRALKPADKDKVGLIKCH
jgi:hypothetical protein